MDEIKRHIALSYKVPRVTGLIDEDIKLIKKINTLFSKLEKSQKDQYMLEIINVFKILDNHFNFNALYFVLVDLIDFRYHDTLNYIITNFDDLNIKELANKFKEETDDEESY